MSKGFWIAAGVAAVAAVGWPLLDVAVAQTLPPAAPVLNLSEIIPLPHGVPDLNPKSNGRTIHILPAAQGARARALALAPDVVGPLVYKGGPVMLTASFYAIFWIPAALQNGGPTGMTAAYAKLQTRFLADFTGHGLASNLTQYYQVVGGITTYIQNATGLAKPGGLADAYVDQAPYPASGCTNPVTAGNCITDAQIQAEIKRVMGVKGWTGGLNKIFLLYTSSGEGSCLDSSSTTCAYVPNGYCAYHQFNNSTSPPIIYIYVAWADPNICNLGAPPPNGDAAADSAVSVASNEINSAITNPFLTGWSTAAKGTEIADLCEGANTFGTNTWTSLVPNDANQMWNGHFYELQQSYDNHAGRCVQIGP